MTPWQDRPVDRRIRGQALIISVVGLAVLGLAVAELGQGTIGPAGVLAGFAGGAAVGVLAARIQRFDWDATAARVVAQVDRIGLGILACLIVATAAREWLFGHWAEGALLNALGLWASAGTLAGRLAGTGRRVAAVLRAARPDVDKARPSEGPEVVR